MTLDFAQVYARVADKAVHWAPEDDTAQKLRAARESLASKVLEDAEAKIVQAADSGARSATLFEFRGRDTYAPDGDTSPRDQFFYLHLVKGPLDRAVQARRARPGAQPAQAQAHEPTTLDLVTAALRPFGVRHAWTEGTDGNAIEAHW